MACSSAKSADVDLTCHTALEGVSILRSVVAFALPLCSPSLSAIMIFRTFNTYLSSEFRYQNLGYGKGNTILAGLVLGLGFPL